MKPFKLTRRKFLHNIAGAGLALSLGEFTTSSLEEKVISSSPSGLQPEVDAESKFMVFSKQLEWIANSDELCQLVAEIGFDGLELTVRPGGYILPESVEEDLPRVAEAARTAGIEIIMISTHITDPRDPFAEKILRTASKLGIKFYRMGGLSYHKSEPIEQTLEEYKAIFRDLAEMNRTYRIHGAYQNHAGSQRMSASIWDLWFLLKDLDSRWIGCQYDTRHSQLEGGSWWPVGLRLLNSHIKITVIKDYKWIQDGNQRKVQNCPIGEGIVDFPTYFELVKEHNITGPISLHFPYPFLGDIDESNKRKRLEQTKKAMKEKGISRLKKMLRQAGLS